MVRAGIARRQVGHDDQIVLADTELEVIYRLDLMIARDFIEPLSRHVVVDIVECAIECA